MTPRRELAPFGPMVATKIAKLPQSPQVDVAELAPPRTRPQPPRLPVPGPRDRRHGHHPRAWRSHHLARAGSSRCDRRPPGHGPARPSPAPAVRAPCGRDPGRARIRSGRLSPLGLGDNRGHRGLGGAGRGRLLPDPRPVGPRPALPPRHLTHRRPADRPLRRSSVRIQRPPRLPLRPPALALPGPLLHELRVRPRRRARGHQHRRGRHPEPRRDRLGPGPHRGPDPGRAGAAGQESRRRPADKPRGGGRRRSRQVRAARQPRRPQ